jgi:hypothetical protein
VGCTHLAKNFPFRANDCDVNMPAVNQRAVTAFHFPRDDQFIAILNNGRSGNMDLFGTDQLN